MKFSGQFDEHEMARSLTPMLFSLTDREASPTLTARIGNGLHPGCKSHWCQHFPLQKGVRVRSFLVSPRDGRPELVYLVGISIRPGRGRYRDTQIVSLAPCYQLYNQSSRRLEVTCISACEGLFTQKNPRTPQKKSEKSEKKQKIPRIFLRI